MENTLENVLLLSSFTVWHGSACTVVRATSYKPMENGKIQSNRQMGNGRFPDSHLSGQAFPGRLHTLNRR